MSTSGNQISPDFFGNPSVKSSDPLSADWQVIESNGDMTTFMGEDDKIYVGSKGQSGNIELKRKNGNSLRNNQNNWKVVAIDQLNNKNIGVFQNNKSGLLQKLHFDSNWRIKKKTKDFAPDSKEGKTLESDLNQYLGIFSNLNDSKSLDNSILATGWQRGEQYYKYQWSLDNTSQRKGYQYDKDIDADNVFSRYAYPNLGVDHNQAWRQNLVAVLDTGVNYRHSDLSRSLARWSDSEPLDGRDNDRNGFIDDIAGWDFVNNDNNAADDQGHGSHVAGISNASANGIGVVGTNPGGYYLPIKVMDRYGRGSTYNIIRGINYARSRGSKVINMSLGGYQYSQASYDAIQSAGNACALVIAAAGNEFNNNDQKPSYPASYNLPNIISVAASDPTDWFVHPNKWGWGTNYGRRSVDLLAPGQSILSDRHNSTSGLVESSGTSMAAPLVAGAVSFYWARNPKLTSAQVKNRLLSTVDKIRGAEKYTVSGGRMNFAKMMGTNPGRKAESSKQSTNRKTDSFKDYEGDPLIEYVPTINKGNIDSFDKSKVTDKVIAFFDGDVEARKDNFNKLKDFVASDSRFSEYTSRVELMDSLDSSIGTIDFKDKLSSVQRFGLIEKIIENGWVPEFEMNSEVSAF